jgi:RND family efflux transporter MFP subunit
MIRWISSLISLLLPVVILAAAGVAVYYLFNTTPKVERKAEKKLIPIVDARPINRAPIARIVDGAGTVVPAREVEIFPEVSGRVVERHINLEIGGIVPKGDVLVRIDPEEYELALEQAQSALAETNAAFEVEKGLQLVAKREWEMFGKKLPDAKLSQSLALREPQLHQAEAKIATAKSLVKQAELDLRRTTILSPFDVLVLEEHVDVGQHVSPGFAIAMLAGAEVFWVQVKFGAEHLNVVMAAANQGGDTVRLFPNGKDSPNPPILGRLVRHIGRVGDLGRNAQVLVEVNDPFGLRTDDAAHQPLVLGTFVDYVELDAGRLDGAVTIVARAKRENSEVWVVDANGQLQIRTVQQVWDQLDTVSVLDVFEPGDRVIVSPVADLLPNMNVRLADMPESETAPADEVLSE